MDTEEQTRILANFARFDAEVQSVEAAYARGDFATAAFFAATAATIATHAHCGIFASPRLEHVLNAIGRRIAAADSGARPCHGGTYRKVLHVGTEVAAVGGLTRMISRWMDADAQRVNSLVLTQHRGQIPSHLTEAVRRSGGQITLLNQMRGNLFDWARTLRRLAAQHDAIICHIHCEDVIPLLAFADKWGLPPVLFLNHADHLFWLGPSISHLVINLREAATAISEARRGVEARRNVLLPTIVDATARRNSRHDAKAKLGLDPEGISLLSVARRPKYRSLDGVSFADRHVSLLERYPKASLIVVGSGDPDDWQDAKAKVGGRIIGLAEQPDPQRYFEAADIYVDSYPFVSSTSMMEAGGYGLPLVTIFTLPDEANIFGINHVGLVGTSLVARTFDDYEAILERLIADPAYRTECGESVRRAMEEFHVPAGWHPRLDAIFSYAASLPPRDDDWGAAPNIELPRLGVLDAVHEDIVGSKYSAAEIEMIYMGALPFPQRLSQWRAMRKRGDIHGVTASSRLLLPEWLKRRLKP
ncbi:glycosyl transferase group 1 [Bradyrhizobium sp. STM 3809]|uniref:glycosyl transferase group 1 n=1 Tax=Bradyrhizobium sp. STM 3809 TaxID=551936 RepID=UPI00024065A8|nr:glycosyl transferase group 1 [Bradyrhizobium sp. STM 3809]CCD99472.1 Glycosyl transferase group 1 [Bradyrhizobium sp. STM 3809]